MRSGIVIPRHKGLVFSHIHHIAIPKITKSNDVTTSYYDVLSDIILCSERSLFHQKKTLVYKLNSGESLDAVTFAISNTQCVCILRDLEYRESACCAVVTSLVMS